MSYQFCRSFIIALSLSSSVIVSAAAEAITIETDHTVIVSIPAQPGAVIVGNPAIVDASIQGGKLLLNGKSFGTTNIVALDQDGNQMMGLEVSVKHTTGNAVAIFKGELAGPQRYSYNCAPYCEATIQIGDSPMYNALVSAQAKSRIQLATGQDDAAKSEAPPPPQ